MSHWNRLLEILDCRSEKISERTETKLATSSCVTKIMKSEWNASVTSPMNSACRRSRSRDASACKAHRLTLLFRVASMISPQSVQSRRLLAPLSGLGTLEWFSASRVYAPCRRVYTRRESLPTPRQIQYANQKGSRPTIVAGGDGSGSNATSNTGWRFC